MEWFYKLLYCLIDNYVYENERQAAKNYTKTILDNCLHLCAQNMLVDLSGLYRLYGINLGVQEIKSNKPLLQQMKMGLSDLAYEYLLAKINITDKSAVTDVLREAEDYVSETIMRLKWPEKEPLPPAEIAEADSGDEDIFVYDGSSTDEEVPAREECSQSASKEEIAVIVIDNDPQPSELQREIKLMFSRLVESTNYGKELFSLETCFGVLSKLYDMVQGLRSLPNDKQTFILHSVFEWGEKPNKKMSEFYQKINLVNPAFTIDLCQKFKVHLQKELYHLASNDKSGNQAVVAAADRLYHFLWTSLGKQITAIDIKTLLENTQQHLKRLLQQDIPPLIDVNLLDQLPPQFFNTETGHEFYITLQKELYDLAINQKTEEDLISASNRLYLILWEINSPIQPSEVTRLLKGSQQRLIASPGLSIFAALNDLPFPQSFFTTNNGYILLERLQNALIHSFNPKSHEHTIEALAENLSESLPQLLMGVTREQMIDLVKTGLSQLKLKLVVDDDKLFYTCDLLKYVAHANTVLGATVYDQAVNQQFITHFQSDKKYSKTQWEADLFAQMLLGLMILYVKQDESYFSLGTGDFWKNNLSFLKETSDYAAGLKELKLIEKAVFALIDHNTMIGHERLQQFVNLQSADIVESLLKDCKKYSLEFYKEMTTYYNTRQSLPRQPYTPLFFSPCAVVEDSEEEQEDMDFQDEEGGRCILQ